MTMKWVTAPLFMTLLTLQLAIRPFFGLLLITLAIKKGLYENCLGGICECVCQ